MPKKQRYSEENFFQTLWNYIPGIVHVLAVVALVFVAFNLIYGVVGTEEFVSDDFEFVAGSPLQREYNYQTGDASSNVTYVIFDDYQCPACRAFNDTKNEVIAAYADRVNIVRKHNPLTQIHTQALTAGRAVQAAGNQGVYDRYGDLVFERQDDLGNDTFKNIAQELDIDFDQWEDDWGSREIRRKVEQDQDDLNDTYLPESSFDGRTKAKGSGAGTPTNVVLLDGEVYDWWTGGQTLESISAVLDNALEGVKREELED